MNGAGVRWVAGRLVAGLVALLVVVVVVVLAASALTDPVRAILGPEAPPAAVDAVRTRLGLDRPLPVRALETLAGVVRGDFGDSYQLGAPAGRLVLEALPATLALVAVAAPVGLGLGVVGGLAVATARRRVAAAGQLALLLVQAVPSFVVAIVAVQLLAVQLRVVPASGPGTRWVAGVLLGLGLAARITVLLADRLMALAREPFVLAALGRGLTRREVARLHLLRPAASIVVSYAAVQVGYLLGGSLVVETVFAYPGVGFLAVEALRDADVPVLLASATLAGLGFLMLRVVADAALVVLDPRVRDDVGAVDVGEAAPGPAAGGLR